MINYKNNDIKEVHYKGFDITQMYACSGNLVWEKEIPDGDYLTFVASSSGVFSCTANVKYSKNCSWWHTLAANGSIDVNSGDVIKWKGSVIPAPNGACRFGSSTAQFSVEGNPMSMILGDNFEGVTSLDGYDYAFEYMFNNCSGLTSIDGLSLPFTTISARCYRAMFAHCTSLTSIPSILSAATVMKEKCYMNMFLGCTNLTSVPNDLLPSTTLAESCYYGMFAESGIIDAEGLELPATTLALSAYTMMFQRATSLEKAPILSAATLVDDCYHSMFYGCSSLSAITCLATSISASNCVFDWVNGVAPSGEFTRESAMTAWQVESINGIPIGWSVIPPFAFKLKATYTDGKSYNLDCNASDTLSSGETHPSGYDYTKMKDVEIGDCTSIIGINALKSSPITSVTIGSGVTSIGNGAFAQCSSLTSVTIPSGVTSIGVQTFWGCSSLTSIEIPNSVTSISEQVFQECLSLTSVTIPSGVTSIGVQAFNRCSGLTSIEIPSGVTSIGVFAFYNCTSLTSITVNATTPPTLGNLAFNNTNNCPIYVPCLSLNAYKADASWSRYANRITCIQSTTAITYSSTSKLNVNMANFTPQATAETYDSVAQTGQVEFATSVTAIGSGFLVKKNLTSVIIPNSVTTIGTSAFNGCSSLTSVTIPDSVTSIGADAFINCTSLTAIEIPNSVTSIGLSAFEGCSGLTYIEIPSGITSVENSTFYNCTSLTSITIPNSVMSIGQNAFNRCSSLASIEIPSGVTTIGYYAFDYCVGLTAITCNATTPPTLGINAFRYTNNCPIYVPCASVSAYKAATNWSTYSSRITCDYGNRAILYTTPTNYKPNIQFSRFTPTATADTYDSTNRTGALEFPSDVTAIGASGFSGAVIATITIPNSVTSIGEYAFYAMSQLTSVNIPTGVTSIPNNAFMSCGVLSSITIPNSVTSIGDNAFASCRSLSSVTIPDSVTSIGLQAFYYCIGLKNVTIGSGITTLSTWVFYKCTALTSVTINAVTPPTIDGFGVFEDTNNCPIYVPSASVNAYKTASGWSTYASRIQAIS